MSLLRSFWIRVPTPLRWSVLAVVAGSVGLFIYSFSLTYTGKYDSVPQEVWASNDPALIRDAAELRGIFVAPSAEEVLGAAGGHEAGAPSMALKTAASRFVDVINRMGEGTILYHETDSFGNLYLVVGVQWTEVSSEHQLVILNGLANNWQRYLLDVFHPGDGAEGFRPGIMLIDTQGIHAQVLDGEISIFRQPVY